MNWILNPPLNELHPSCVEDLCEILKQVRENGSSIRVSCGSFPFRPLKDDIVVNLGRMDKLLGLDIQEKRVTVEPGMKLSALFKILETVSLSLDMVGRVPDLTIGDALAIGLSGVQSGGTTNLIACEVLKGSGKRVKWNWERNPNELKSLCSGLGNIAIPISISLQCIQLQCYVEASYLYPISQILGQWKILTKDSMRQQLFWFPLSDLAVLTHISSAPKYQTPEQPMLCYVSEKLGEILLRLLHHLSSVICQQIPILSTIFARLQFFLSWTVSKNRSDFLHSLPRMWAASEATRGSLWLLPIEQVPKVLRMVSKWAKATPHACSGPLFLQSVSMEGISPRESVPFIAPYLDEPSCAMWYDWFLSEKAPNPIQVAEFESIFHEAGGMRCWSADRIISPLVLTDMFPNYNRWCNVKAQIDKYNFVQGAYIHGTVYSRSGFTDISESTLSLCSSLCE
ncbi:L-gulonolactone oxidase-like [Tigriopus californicus]|nr:L-gulonolactone oxidase-like [Tigriopus californicus]